MDFESNTGRREVTDVSGYGDRAVVTELNREAAPYACIVGTKWKKAIREQQGDSIEPRSEIICKLRVPSFLLANAGLDFAKHDDTEKEVLLRLSNGLKANGAYCYTASEAR